MAEQMEKVSGITPENACVFLLQARMRGDGHVSGTVHRFYRQETVHFAGLDQAFLQINDWLNGEGVPSDDMVLRTFSVGKGSHTPALSAAAAEEKKTAQSSQGGPGSRMESFLIRVMYRQHHSWQGEVCWHNQRSYFRSELELMSLIHSVFEGSHRSITKTVFKVVGQLSSAESDVGWQEAGVLGN